MTSRDKNRALPAKEIGNNPRMGVDPARTSIEKIKDHERKEKHIKHEDRIKDMFTLDTTLADTLTLPMRVDNHRAIIQSVRGTMTITSNDAITKSSNNLTTNLLPDKSKSRRGSNHSRDKREIPDPEPPKAPKSEYAFLPEYIGTSNMRYGDLNGDITSSHDRNAKSISNQKQTQPATTNIGPDGVDDVTAILANIKTGDDAVNYFARYGSETPVKFIHLVNTENTRDFAPYDLTVSSQNEIASEHYIMSSVGLTHVTPTEQSDCIPLSQWMKQKINFGILRMIPFFKYYLHRKVFNIWFENVRYQLFLKQRKKVTERLFIARKTTNPAILATKKHLKDIRSVQLLSLIGLDFKPSDKDVIMERQLSQLSKAGAQFEEFVRRIIVEVNNVINDVNNLHSQAYQDQSNLLSFADTVTPEKLKSLVRLKQEKQERKLMRHRAKIEFQTLPDFIRYMDYVVLENFFELTVHGIEKFYDEFVKTRKTGIFETMIRFTAITESEAPKLNKQSSSLSTSEVITTKTVFSPTCSDIETMIDRLFESVIDTVGNLNRVGYVVVKAPAGINVNNQQNALGMSGTLNATNFAATNNQTMSSIALTNISSVANSSLTANIQAILHENKQFRHVLENIHQRIVNDFERAEEHALIYDALKPIYKFNSEWNIESYRSLGYDITQIKIDLERISTWIKDLDKLRNRPIGILDVDSRKLKMELNPVLELRLAEIKEYIKDMARFRCQQLLDHYKDCINKFTLRPVILKEFCNQIQFVLTSKEDEKNLFIQTSQVDQMYNLLQLYEVSIPSEDSVLHEQLHDRQVDYKREIQAVAQYHEQNRQDMVKAVNDNIVKLNKNIEQFLEKLDDPDFTMTLHYEDSDTILDDLELRSDEYKSLNNLAKTYSNYQRLLNETSTEYSDLEFGLQKLSSTKNLWETISKWNESYENWNESQFSDLSVEKIDKQVAEYFKETVHLNQVIPCKATDKLTNQVNDFKKLMPSILALGNKHMKARHFEKLFKLVNQVYYQGMPFSLFQIRKGGLMNFKDIISETSDVASGEAQLEESLTKIKDAWEKTKFSLKLYKEQQNLHILGSLDPIFSQLDNHQTLLQTMLTSRFIKGLLDRVDSWDKKLILLSDILDEWIICQKQWMHLENIFTIEDVQKQLPLESQKFLLVDRSWKNIMIRTANDPLAINCLQPLENTQNTSLLSTLRTNNEILESIQKSLDDYLDTKRQIFPRLYFLSNDELLELLAQSKDSHAIEGHLFKCFDAIQSVKFNSYDHDRVKGKIHKGYDEIVGFTDHMGEYVKFQVDVMPSTPATTKSKDSVKETAIVRAEGPVEQWLLAFERSMRSTIFLSARDATNNYPSNTNKITAEGLLQFIGSYPAQIVSVVDNLMWTSFVTGGLYSLQNGLNSTSLSNFKDSLLQLVEIMVTVIRKPLKKLQRSCLATLLLQNVHNRDITKALVDENVQSLNDYAWIRQIKYYWDINQQDIQIKQGHASFGYGYEYIGHAKRLVMTPLTELCYLTLTSALAIQQGGALTGPSGTGKTETIKDLARAFAMPCITFNCSHSVNYKLMGRMLGGLAQQGSWLCLDEFNRIDVDVLSVVAQQVLAIQQALLSKASQFDFNGTIISLNHKIGIFLTMNPSNVFDKHDRVELPENLNSLFRPVSMLTPDNEIICAVILYSEGFLNGPALSRKIIQFYSLCKDQLSNQPHYDFGLRALSALLSTAGQSKRRDDIVEESLIFRLLRDSTIPKLVEQDIPILTGILADIFPGLKVPSTENTKLYGMIEKSMQNMSLQKSSTLVHRIAQIHDLQMTRCGVVIVGNACTGKSISLRVLQNVYELMKSSNIITTPRGSDSTGKDYENPSQHNLVDAVVVNPKALSLHQLYGYFSEKVDEWKDGLVATIVRDSIKPAEGVEVRDKWLIFDGPLDSDWAECMNTAMDDTRTLCLINSERIKIPSNLKILFETSDLNDATPAIVSRCGIVYMEQATVSMLSLVRTWGSTTLSRFMSKASAKIVASTIEANIEAAITFIHSECNECISSTNNHLVESFLNVFIAKLAEYLNIDIFSVNITTFILPSLSLAAAETLVQDIDLMNALVLWCLIWSVGGNIDEDSRRVFQEWCRNRFSTTISSKYSAILHDPYGTCLDLVAKDVKQWQAMTIETAIDSSIQSEGSLIIPTVDTIRYTYLLEKLAPCHQNVLFVGSDCVGKSMIINSFVSKQSQLDKAISYTLNCTSNTSVDHIYQILDTKLEVKRKNLIGPVNGKKFYLFLDDMHIVSRSQSIDKQVNQSTDHNELLRQLLDAYAYYEPKKLFLKRIQDMICIGAIDPSYLSSTSLQGTSGSNRSINTRLLRKFHLFALNNLTLSGITSIFTSICKQSLQSVLNEANQSIVEVLVSSSLGIYQDLSAKLFPILSKSHYHFSIREVSKIYQNLSICIAQDSISSNEVVRAFTHEVSRVLRDRLVTKSDREIYDQIVIENVNKSIENCYPEEAEASDESIERIQPIKLEDIKDLTYSCLIPSEDAAKPSVTAYSDISTLENDLMTNISSMEGSIGLSSNMIFDKETLKHLCRLARIFSLSNEHAALISDQICVGRKTITKLVCKLRGFRYNELDLSEDRFQKAIVRILLQAASQKESSVIYIDEIQLNHMNIIDEFQRLIKFLNTSHHIAGDDILAYLDLSADREELDDILLQQGVNVQTQGRDINAIDMHRLHENIVQRVKIVLSISPKFIDENIGRFPVLFHHLTYDYYYTWSNETLYSVGYQIIQSSNDVARTDSSQAMAQYQELCDLILAAESQFTIQSIGSSKESEKGSKKAVQWDMNQLLPELFRRFYDVAVSETANDKNIANILTNRTYIQSLHHYRALYEEYTTKISAKKEKYQKGLQKLKEMSAIASDSENHMKSLRSSLEKANKELEEGLQSLASEQQLLDSQTVIVETDTKKLNEVMNEVQRLSTELQNDIDAVYPEYSNVMKEIRNFKAPLLPNISAQTVPPEPVKLVFEAVYILLDRRYINFSEVLTFIRDGPEFLKKLLNFDKDSIPLKSIKRLEKYISDPSFSPEVLKASDSVQMMWICEWVLVHVHYDRVVKPMVSAKRQALELAQEKLSTVQITLSKKQAILDEIKGRMANLSKIVEETKLKKQEYENHIELESKKGGKTLELLESLQVEKMRWDELSAKYEGASKNAPGDIAIAAGFMTYCGLFHGHHRNKTIKTWMQICKGLQVPVSEVFKLSDILYDSPYAITNGWSELGLPSDTFTQDSTMILTSCERNHRCWPLLIDPEGHANTWLQRRYSSPTSPSSSSKSLIVIKQTDSKDTLCRVLEDCVKSGYSLLYEDITGKLDGCFTNLINHQYNRSVNKLSDTNHTVIIDGKEIIIDPSFKLYFSSKSELSVCLCEGMIDKLTIIDFSVSNTSLEEQLLDEIIKFERPDIFEKRGKLNQSLVDDKLQLEAIESEILSQINSTDKILENDDIVTSLMKSNASILNIQSRIYDTQNTLQEIATLCEAFRALATRGSVLYQVISSLHHIHPCYTYSLNYFKSIFHRNIPKSAKKEALRQRVSNLVTEATKSVILSISNSLLTKDKLLYRFLIAVNIQMKAKIVHPSELKLFISGQSQTIERPGSQSTKMRSPIATAKRAFPTIFAQLREANSKYPITEELWNHLVMLEDFEAIFEGLCGDLMGKSSAWVQYLSADSITSQRLPGIWETKLNEFQKILLLKFLREDSLISLMKRYVVSVLGEPFSETPSPDLNISYMDSNNHRPIVFILEPGIDPIYSLFHLAKDKGILESNDDSSAENIIQRVGGKGNIGQGVGVGGLHLLSLGQGQESIAEKAIEECQRSGYWLCLQNCHLLSSWLPTLEHIIAKTMFASSDSNNDKIHPNFRLWLTTLPIAAFPSSIRRNSIKFLQDSSKGLGANMLSLFSNEISNEEYSIACGCQDPVLWRKLLFALIYFHASITERKSYRSKGWNSQYNWTTYDFRVSKDAIKMYIDEFTESIRLRKLDMTIRASMTTQTPEQQEKEEEMMNEIAKKFPWDGLKTTIADIVYGGRISDPCDKRLLKSILDRIMCSELLQDENFKFTSKGNIVCPSESATRETVWEYLRSLQVDSAEAIGLHRSIELGRNKSEIHDLINTLNQLQLSEYGAEGTKSLRIAQNVGQAVEFDQSKVLTVIKDIKKRIPGSFDDVTPYSLTFENISGMMNPLGVYLSQEMAKFNVLLRTISESITQLMNSLDCYVHMSNNSLELFKSISDNVVPKLWRDVSYLGSKQLNKWIDNLELRVQFISKWISEGPQAVYFISYFFCPQAFISAIKQTYARKHKVSVDSLHCDCEITSFQPKDIRNPPANGVYIHGLYLEGAHLNRDLNMIEDTHSTKPQELLPCVLMKFSQSKVNSTANQYLCPVYKTSSRGTLIAPSSYAASFGYSANFIVTIPLAIDQNSDADFWVRRGCAIVCLNEEDSE